MTLLHYALRGLWTFVPQARVRPKEIAFTPPDNALSGAFAQPFLAAQTPVQPLNVDSAEYDVLEKALARWRQALHSAVALLGPCGFGKSSVLKRIQASHGYLPLRQHQFTSRILGEAQFFNHITNGLNLPDVESVHDLAAHLQAGPRQVVLLDDCQLLFLRRPSGFVPLDLLLRLITLTSRHVLWITTWNVYSWMYLENIRNLSDQFAIVHSISRQPLHEMQQMLVDRARRAHLRVTWPAETTDFVVKEIATSARGSPTLAQHVFLRSLQPTGHGQFTLQPNAVYRLPHQCEVRDQEEAFALANLVRHGALTVRELASINHITETEAAAVLARTTAKDLTVCVEPEYRLNPIYINAVVAFLDSRRAIAFREVQAN
jgi:hypothetical protein